MASESSKSEQLSKRPLFSIVIPVFKVEPFLEQCLQSLISQTFTDFECIIVNDGSPGLDINLWYQNQDVEFIHKFLPPSKLDTSAQVKYVFDNVTKVMSKKDQFQLISTDNQGLGMARNTGIKNTTGHYLICLDGDDYLDKNYLQSTKDAIDSNKLNPKITLTYNQVQVNNKGVYSPYNSIVKHLRSTNSLANIMVFPSMTATPIGYCWELDHIKSQNLQFISERGEDTTFFFDNILSITKSQELSLQFSPSNAIYYYRQFDNQMSKESAFKINLFRQTSSYMKGKANIFLKKFGLKYYFLAVLFSWRFDLYRIKLITSNKLTNILSTLTSKSLTILSLLISRI